MGTRGEDANKNVNKNFSDLCKSIFTKWKAMTEEERRPFEVSAQKDKKRYKQEVLNLKNRKIELAIRFLTDKMKQDKREKKEKPWHKWVTTLKT